MTVQVSYGLRVGGMTGTSWVPEDEWLRDPSGARPATYRETSGNDAQQRKTPKRAGQRAESAFDL